MTLRMCSGCGRSFINHRREDVCPDCRAAIRVGAMFIGHRLDLVRQKAGDAPVAGVLAALEDEGFVVSPPGSAVVPADWLIALRQIIDPEPEIAAEPSPFARAGAFDRIRDHVANLPVVERIIATTGVLS